VVVRRAAVGETLGGRGAIMAAKKSKANRSKKAAPRRAPSKKVPPRRAAKKVAPKAPKKSRRAVTKPAKKAAAKSNTPAKRKLGSTKPVPKKRVAPKATPPKRQPPAAALADNVRDCVSGTPVWFTVAGGIEHAAIQRRGTDGTVVIVTDAGATEVVASSNLFETAEEARAARSR